MRRFLIPLAVLVGMAGVIGCSPSAKYSSAEAAAIVTQKMANNLSNLEHMFISGETVGCSYLVEKYYSGKWIAEEKAHLLKFLQGELKYFESSETI